MLNTWHERYKTYISSVTVHIPNFMKISQLVSVILTTVGEMQGMEGSHKTHDPQFSMGVR
jgi:hypothetical protein